MQYGEGFLNYINGYTSKASDALDFRLKEHLAKDGSHRWRMTYRLMCKQALCVPEIVCQLAGLSMMRRSFCIDTFYAPVPRKDVNLAGNVSLRLYAFYLKQWCPGGGTPLLRVNRNLLAWLRSWRLKDNKLAARQSVGTVAIGLRFAFELLDIYLGQFCFVFPSLLCRRVRP